MLYMDKNVLLTGFYKVSVIKIKAVFRSTTMNLHQKKVDTVIRSRHFHIL